MIKAGGRTADGRPMLVIGLSRKNTEKLLAGQPIRFNASEIGLDAEVIVLGGETENDLVQDLRVLGPITEYRPPP